MRLWFIGCWGRGIRSWNGGRAIMRWGWAIRPFGWNISWSWDWRVDGFKIMHNCNGLLQKRLYWLGFREQGLNWQGFRKQILNWQGRCFKWKRPLRQGLR